MNGKKSVLWASALLGLTVVFLLSGIPNGFTEGDREGMKTAHEGQMDDDGMEMGSPGSHPFMPGPGMGMPWGGHPPMASYYWEELKLNDKQKEQMHKVYTEYSKEMVRRQADIRIAEMDLADLIEEKKVDMAAVEKAVKKVEGLRRDRTLYRVKALMKTRDFLTEEQFEKYRSRTLHQLRHSGSWGAGHHENGMMPGMMEKMMMPGEGSMGPGMMHPR
ncbi:MAG: periplasmic heavy metal sensor [Nitrospirae bacterium]|nr:periplasmic heavy metal sensor [Nitrospirota bacterium]